MSQNKLKKKRRETSSKNSMQPRDYFPSSVFTFKGIFLIKGQIWKMKIRVKWEYTWERWGEDTIPLNLKFDLI